MAWIFEVIIIKVGLKLAVAVVEVAVVAVVIVIAKFVARVEMEVK